MDGWKSLLPRFGRWTSMSQIVWCEQKGIPVGSWPFVPLSVCVWNWGFAQNGCHLCMSILCIARPARWCSAVSAPGRQPSVVPLLSSLSFQIRFLLKADSHSRCYFVWFRRFGWGWLLKVVRCCCRSYGELCGCIRWSPYWARNRVSQPHDSRMDVHWSEFQWVYNVPISYDVKHIELEYPGWTENLELGSSEHSVSPFR